MSLDRQKALASGMDFFLTKPVSKFALMQTIADLILRQQKREGPAKSGERSRRQQKAKKDALLLLPQAAMPRDLITGNVVPGMKGMSDGGAHGAPSSAQDAAKEKGSPGGLKPLASSLGGLAPIAGAPGGGGLGGAAPAPLCFGAGAQKALPGLMPGQQGSPPLAVGSQSQASRAAESDLDSVSMSASRDGGGGDCKDAAPDQPYTLTRPAGSNNPNGFVGSSTATDMPEMHVDERTGIVRFGGSQDAHYQVRCARGHCQSALRKHAH